ncbi:MAG TPA: sigma-70 family RNA polymerase sigma factor [Gemmatimonadaceae bacterium]|jgi:RNA polymerase sigma-70 factor (family 1)|nr:sigma-70 family RNA polymerase sigma factor [Gemmatimonadaceae bacterium]
MPPLRHRWAAPEEHQLIHRIRDGDTSAFETLFHSYFAAVLRFASSFLTDRETAEDLVQEVFAWIWIHRAEWDPSSDILSYLLTSVRNRALDVLRTDKRHAEISERYMEPGQSPAMATTAIPIDTRVEEDERNNIVWRVVLQLPEHRRTVLLLRWRHGLEWDEIARIMETSVAAARMNHSRALHLMRQLLPDAIQ